MARRSRKRRKPRPKPAGPPAEPAAHTPQRTAQDQRPPAPWGSFPLAELMVLAGLLLLIAGLIVSGYRGSIMVGGGLALGALAGVELSLREHLAGYRSHSLLLAGTAGVGTVAALFALAPGLSPAARLGAGAAVFGLLAVALRRVFRRRSGGASFRIGNYRG